MANVLLTDGTKKELLQTPKNREARNILNICHATQASPVNFCAGKRERAGPQPFAATPPRHPAAAAVPRRLRLLPRQASSTAEYVSLTAASGHSRKTSKSRHFELKCCWGEAGLFAIFFFSCLLVIQDDGFLTSSPCGKAKPTLFFYTRCICRHGPA